MATVPAYKRIFDDISRRLLDGAIAAGERLPSEQALASQYGVTRVTVRRALEELAKRGLVARRHGVGTFVLDPVVQRPLNRLSGFSQDMNGGNRRLRAKVLEQGAVVAPERVRAKLDLGRDELATKIVRVRFVDDSAVSYQAAWVPFSRCPALASEQLVAGSLYRSFERCGITLSRATQTVTAAAADDGKAQLLGVLPSSPLIYLVRHSFDEKGLPVEYARSWTRPEFPLAVELRA